MTKAEHELQPAKPRNLLRWPARSLRGSATRPSVPLY